jgi:hypothetical protein
MVRKAGLEPASLAALAPKASVFAISPLPHMGGQRIRASQDKSRGKRNRWQCSAKLLKRAKLFDGFPLLSEAEASPWLDGGWISPWAYKES